VLWFRFLRRAIHAFRSIESGLATLRDHPLDATPTVGEILISGRQCPEGMHVVRQQHPSLDHKRMGQTERSDRFPQGRAHIDFGEKGLAPIAVGNPPPLVSGAPWWDTSGTLAAAADAVDRPRLSTGAADLVSSAHT
jgi:hypothetical protein